MTSTTTHAMNTPHSYGGWPIGSDLTADLIEYAESSLGFLDDILTGDLDNSAACVHNTRTLLRNIVTGLRVTIPAEPNPGYEAYSRELDFLVDESHKRGLPGAEWGAEIAAAADRVLEAQGYEAGAAYIAERRAVAKKIIDEKVSSGDLVRLTNGGLIEADRFDPAKHTRRTPSA